MSAFFMTLLANYWGIVAFIIVAIGYFFTHKAVAINYAKKRISTLMLSAEKGAEQLFLNNGQAKLQWVVDKGYDMMPSAVRLFIGKPVFASLVQDLFNSAKGFIEKHKTSASPSNSQVNQVKNSSDQLFS